MKSPHESMTPGGVGPMLILITLPYVALVLIMMNLMPDFLKLSFLDITWVKYLAYVLIGAGVIFWISSVITFGRNFSKGTLITTGTYGLCRNPIYASFIVFILPGLALLFASGLLFTITIVFYLNFKLCIHGERMILRRTFGDAYLKYEKEVREVLPIPK
ncbi:MAG: isoprenylcysteine carboxylmethyltransferase family protein [Bacteroidales bacterium]|nr:isoprenylcysteine carboxylmethyltransferase family protein [Bacteroidales bacterium]